MIISSRPIAAAVLCIAFLSLVIAERPLRGQDLDMYNAALVRYWSASQQSVGHYNMLQWHPDPQEHWRNGPMKDKWLARAEITGAMHVGSARDWLNRKVTYFSTFVLPDGNDALANQMRLNADLPVEGGLQPKEAAIFWKHVGGSFQALRIDILNHFGAAYGLESLNSILHHGSAQVFPLV